MILSRAVTDHDKYVGNRIRFYRHERGMSQATLAEALLLTFQQIQKYEKGSNRVAGGRLSELASIFQCSVADLLPPVKKNGKAKPPSPYEAIITMDDGRRLIEAFLKIDDERMRRAVVKVAQELARTTEP